MHSVALTFAFFSDSLPFLGTVLVGLADKHTFVDTQHLATLMQISGTDDLFGYDGYALNNVLDELRTLERIATRIAQKEVGLEDNEVGLVCLDILAELGGIVLTRKTVGVVAVGQKKYLDVHALGKEHVGSAECGMDAGTVAVVKQCDVGCESVEKAYLRFVECCSGVGNNVFNSALVHGDDIGVALDHVDTVFLDDGLLCLENAIEFVALMEYL